MRDYTFGVAGLSQDVEQLVVGQEEKARENSALGLQVIVESILHTVESFVCFVEARKKVFVVHDDDCKRIAEDFRHGRTKHLVNSSEFPDVKSDACQRWM